MAIRRDAVLTIKITATELAVLRRLADARDSRPHTLGRDLLLAALRREVERGEAAP